MVYYGNHRELEYDFVVAPGVDPNIIALDIDGSVGAQQLGPLQLGTEGDLVLQAGDVEIRFHKPVAYQQATDARLQRLDSSAKHFIESRYLIKGEHQVGFQLAAYDVTKPVIIDPVLSYSSYLGGSGDDIGSSIAVDASGDVYLIGSTGSIDLSTTSGSFQTNFGGGMVDGAPFGGDAFVTKLSHHGSVLAYTTYLGGSGGEFGNTITVDSSGHAYVTGFTLSADFPTTAGAVQTECKVRPSGECSGEAFVTKLNTTGSALVYSTYLGGSGDDYGIGVAVDDSGNAYITGYTESTDLRTTAGAFQTACKTSISPPCNEAFVTKLDPTGSALVYSTYLGGSGTEEFSQQGYDIAVDSSGDAYVTGFTSSPDFPTTSGAFQTACTPSTSGACSSEAFVTKLDAAGSALVYSTYLGGSDFDQALSLSLDHFGNAYVTGFTASVDFPTNARAFQRHCELSSLGGCSEAFVTKLNRTGSALLYSTYLGGSSDEFGLGIVVSPSSNAYVTGGTGSSDFPTVRAFQPTIGGGFDAFVAELNRSGSALVHSSYLGGSGDDVALSIALHGDRSVYLTGDTTSADFPISRRAIQSTFAGGGTDAFVVKVQPF
jgi:hypothetical protein